MSFLLGAQHTAKNVLKLISLAVFSSVNLLHQSLFDFSSLFVCFAHQILLIVLHELKIFFNCLIGGNGVQPVVFRREKYSIIDVLHFIFVLVS